MNQHVLRSDLDFLFLLARFEANPTTEQRQVSAYRNWNPPLLGNLPDDFLRILPQQRDSLQVNL